MATVFEIRVIKPKKFVDAAKLRRAIETEYRAAAEGAKRDLQATTASWDHKVVFRTIRQGSGYLIYTTSNLYELVSETGAKPHSIVAQKAKQLRFRVPYKAKTRPGVLSSSSGGSGDTGVRAKAVRHPGFQPRRFVEAVRKKWENPLYRKIVAAMAREA